MTYGSLFTGIGGFDLAFDRAGMACLWQIENDPNCNNVLRKHWPEVKRHGDITQIDAKELARPDLVCGGFPCQDLSIAGKREGLAGKRSGLWFEFLRILWDLKVPWVVIENVPGLFSSGEKHDFRTILQGLDECGYHVAWRTMDAQFTGVPQRRRRIFFVGHLGSGRAAEVLFEPESLCWNLAEGTKKRTGIAALTADGVGTCGVDDNQAQAGHLIACYENHGQDSRIKYNGNQSPTLHKKMGTGGNNVPLIAFAERTRKGGRSFECQEEKTYAITNPGSGGTQHSSRIAGSFGVRRLMPVECERAQGFPDSWTETGMDENGNEVKLSDSARYRMIGNAVAVPVAEWIGRRIINA